MKRTKFLSLLCLRNLRMVLFKVLLLACIWTIAISWNGTAHAVRGPNALEDLFWELVNRFREDPLSGVESLGIDIKPWQRVYLQTSLPPLAWSQTIQNALCENVENMLNGGYYSLDSPDGGTLVARLHQMGYTPLSFDSILGLFTFRTVVSEATVLEFLLKNIIEGELSRLEQEPPKLLNKDFHDIGVCIQPAQLDNIVGYPVNGYVCALVFSTNAQDSRPSIVGRIYEDQNGNDIWDFGEGLEDVTVRLKGGESDDEVPVVSEEGMFVIAAEPGMYSLEVRHSGELLFRGAGYVLRDHNVRIDVGISRN